MISNIPECPSDPTLQEDLNIIAADHELAEALRGKNILVTGATGLVGSWLIHALACMNRTGCMNGSNGMMIYGVIRNPVKAETIYGNDFMARPDVCFIQGDICSPDFATTAARTIQEHSSQTYRKSAQADGMALSGAGLSAESGSNDQPPCLKDRPALIDLIIHGASVTTSKTMVEKPVETIMTAIEGTKHVLDLAAACGKAEFVYLSSMEMYGNLGCNGMQPVATEDRLGWLDLSNVRTDYPESKRMCENLCIGYGAEYGLNVRIARLAQTFGAGILPWENRVFAQFARSVIRGENIVLHTKGLSEGNYCYTRDAVRGILTIAVQGKTGEAYNVANEETHTTIAAMAEMVAKKIAGGKIHVIYDIPETNAFGYAADTKLRLDSSKLRKLGWKPEVGLEEMYRRMIASMKAGS